MRILRVLLINLLVVALIVVLFEAFFALNPKATLEKNTYFSDRAEKYRYQQQALLPPSQLPVEVPMPFFGFGIDYSEQVKKNGFSDESNSFKINNYKFRSDFDYPYIKKEDEVVIGIFGGSFAFNWVVYENKIGEFAKKLPTRIADLKNKKIILLNMAQLGAKQPQQFFVFAYFYKMLDAAIIMDGLNEISLATPVSFPLEFPIFSGRFYSMDKSEFREDLAQSNRDAREIQRRIVSMQFLHPWLTQSYLYYVFDASMADYVKNRIAKNLILRDGGGGNTFYRKDFTFDEKISASADIWSKYTVLTHDLAKKNKIKMFHYLQPNQYLNSKPLSSYELKNSFDKTTQPHVQKGYSLLIDRQQQLGAQNYKISTQLMKAFENETEDLYIDDCCHVGDAGNAILTRKLLDLVAADWH